jgi:hypothetical protein
MTRREMIEDVIGAIALAAIMYGWAVLLFSM